MNCYKIADILSLGLQLDTVGLMLPNNSTLNVYIPDNLFDELILSRKFKATSPDSLIHQTQGGNHITLVRQQDERSLQDN